MRQCLAFLDAVLSTRTFLVGERATLADISLVCNLLTLYKQVQLLAPPISFSAVDVQV